ncbi:MAG: hypothetical protein WKF37_07450 [Bryobacteraceae bacterium]
MDAPDLPREGKSLLDALVGIELGVIGGVAMLLWFLIISPVLGKGWWLIPNLFASHFYGSRPVLAGPGEATWAGTGIHLVISGTLGGINGIVSPGGRLFGLGLTVAWYLLCYFVLWERYAPLMNSAPNAVLMIGYFLFGSALGWHRHLVDYAIGRTTEQRVLAS